MAYPLGLIKRFRVTGVTKKIPTGKSVKTRKRVFLISAGVLLCCALWACWHYASNPSGYYYDRYIDSGENTTYWVLEHGKVHMRTLEPNGSVMSDNYLGVYSRSNGAWLYVNGHASDERAVLRAS